MKQYKEKRTQTQGKEENERRKLLLIERLSEEFVTKIVL